MYDNAKRESIYLGALTLTSAIARTIEASNVDERIKLVDILVRPTTTFAGATTTPTIKAGTSGDDDKVLTAYDFGTLAAGTAWKSVRELAGRAKWVDGILENGDDLLITIVEATGAGAAGAAEVIALIERG